MTAKTLPEMPPAGFEFAWVATSTLPDGNRWFLLETPASDFLCRGDVYCTKHPVARLNRSKTPKPRWWYYCGDHLGDRRIRDGVLETRVLRPAEEGAADV